MKSVSLILCFLLCMNCKAQKTERQMPISGIVVGAYLSPTAVYSFEKREPDQKPFEVEMDFLGAVNFWNKKTHAGVMYDFSNHGICGIAGFLLKKDWDVYTFFEQSLMNEERQNRCYYLGIEKCAEINENFEIVVLAEFGVDTYLQKSVNFAIQLYPHWGILFGKTKE